VTSARCQRVTATFADASYLVSLRQAFAALNMVVLVASSAEWTLNIATVALEASIDYLDV
jgi:hypothetical protein